jgi:hypothetical protein
VQVEKRVYVIGDVVHLDQETLLLLEDALGGIRTEGAVQDSPGLARAASAALGAPGWRTTPVMDLHAESVRQGSQGNALGRDWNGISPWSA